MKLVHAGCLSLHKNTAAAAAAKLPQSCPTLCDPINSSLPGSPVPGILQARTLEWVAIAFSVTEILLSTKKRLSMLGICPFGEILLSIKKMIHQ